jgi:hypothetical protein
LGHSLERKRRLGQLLVGWRFLAAIAQVPLSTNATEGENVATFFYFLKSVEVILRLRRRWRLRRRRKKA